MIVFVHNILKSLGGLKAKILAMLVLFSLSDVNAQSLSNHKQAMDKKWWKEAVVYQIYPRSFKDSNGDGVGDLKGIISKLDYIKSLGVDVVWLNPIYASPNADNGYDISDYRAIMTEFGTMGDFDTLLKGLHDRKIKLVMDLVINHSSDEHEWFKQARSSRTNPYRNYYHWWPAEKGTPPKRYSFFDDQNNAWKYDSLTNAYYLHYFSVKQPDLNWENPALRKDVYSAMKFWLDKGIDGFRMDALAFISKDTSFPVKSFTKLTDFPPYYTKGPHLHEYLHEMNREVLSKYDILTVAETFGASREDAIKYIDPDRQELNMLYHFEGARLGIIDGPPLALERGGYKLSEFKSLYTTWDSIFNRKAWGTIYLGNHDQPRMVSRWGNDSPEYRVQSSKLLTTFLLTMHATPYYFAGDELGMTNIKFDNISDYRDIETLNTYNSIKKTGGDVKAYLDVEKVIARDNGRTPFQWDATANAGFTTGSPWIKVNADHVTVNAAVQEKDSMSTLNYFREMIMLRKKHPALIYGKYQLLDKGNSKIYAYSRKLNDESVLIILNFSDSVATFQSPFNLKVEKSLASNYAAKSYVISKSKVTLPPYGALVLSVDGN